MSAWSLTGWVTLALAAATGAENAPGGPTSLPEPISTQQEYFFIPFQVDPGQNTPPLSQVELWASGDRGQTWKHYYTVDPQTLQFPFRAGGDGEFWFAIRTIDAQGQARPEQIHEAGLRVVVDTTPPKLTFEADRDASGQVRARWKIEEKNLAENGLVIQYRAAPSDPWQDVPIRRSAGGTVAAQSETAWWAPRDAAQLDIRAEVVDRAGNRDLRHAQLKLTDEATDQGLVDPFQIARNTPPAMRPGTPPAPSSQPEPFQPESTGQRGPAATTYGTPATTYGGPDTARSDAMPVGQYGQQSTSNPHPYADGADRLDRPANPSRGDTSRNSWSNSASSARTETYSPTSGPSYDQESSYGTNSSYAASSSSGTNDSYGTNSSYGSSPSYATNSPPSSAQGETVSSSPYGQPDDYRTEASWQDSSTGSSGRDRYASARGGREEAPTSYASDTARSPYGTDATSSPYGTDASHSPYGTDTSSSSYASDATGSSYAADQSSSTYASDRDSRQSRGASSWYSVDTGEEESPVGRYDQGRRDWNDRSTAVDGSADRATDPWRSGENSRTAGEDTRGSETESWRSDEPSSRTRGRAKRSVRIVSAEAATGRNADRVRIRWETQGPSLASNTVKLFYATSRFGPWETMAENLMSTAGEYLWQPDESLRGYVYIRIEIPEPSGKVLEAETPQPVRLPDKASTRSASTGAHARKPDDPWAESGDAYTWP